MENHHKKTNSKISKKFITQRSIRLEWPSILFLFFVCLFLGFWGYIELNLLGDFDRGESNNILYALYDVIQLFFFSAQYTQVADLPWQLEVSRFLAPLITIAAFIETVAFDVKSKLKIFKFQFLKSNHTVICGLGDLGLSLILAAENVGINRKQIIVIDHNENPIHTQGCENLDIPVLIGDVNSSTMLQKSGACWSSQIIVVGGDDGINAEIAKELPGLLEYTRINSGLWGKSRNTLNRALQLIGLKKHTPTKIKVHISDTRLLNRLDNYLKLRTSHLGMAEVRFFNIYIESARQLLQKYPPEIYADLFNKSEVHIAIYGFGMMGEAILAEICKTCIFRNFSTPKITILDRNAPEIEEHCRRLYPNLFITSNIFAAEINFITFDFRIVGLSDDDLIRIPTTATQHILCFGNESHNIQAALILREKLLNWRDSNQDDITNPPLFVRIRHEDGLSRLVESNQGEAETPDTIFPFGSLEDGVSPILHNTSDTLAQEYHSIYRKTRDSNRTAGEARREAEIEWYMLDEFYRESNRANAAHLDVKLRSIRCRQVNKNNKETQLPFSNEEKLLLSKMEKSRWNAFHWINGYVPGSTRVKPAKIHELLVPWDSLKKSDQALDDKTILNVNEILSVVRKTIKRELYIGVIGVGPKSSLDKNSLIIPIKTVMNTIKKEYPDRVFTVLSSLAAGSDTILAKAAMKHLDAKLIAPLPLPFELYKEVIEQNIKEIVNSDDNATYRIEKTLLDFRKLVGSSDCTYLEVPMRFGNLAQLGSSEELRYKQYLLAAAYIVERADILIAIQLENNSDKIQNMTAQVIDMWNSGEIPKEFATKESFIARPNNKKRDLIIINTKGKITELESIPDSDI